MAEVTLHEYLEKIIYPKGDEMDTKKIKGTCLGNKVVLDNPVNNLSVYKIDRRRIRNIKDGRYLFHVSFSKGTKPEIISATEISNSNEDTQYTVILRGQEISDQAQPEVAEMVVLSELVKAEYAYSFKDAQKIIDEAVKSGYALIKVCDTYSEASGIIQQLSPDDNIHLFSIETRLHNEPKITEEKQQHQEGEFIGNFWLQPDLVPVLSVFEQVVKSGERVSFLLTGDAGYGKTSAYAAMAEKLGIDLLEIDCSTMLNTTDWFGIMQAKDGSTFFELTDFTHALRKGNTIIVLDEFNRLSIDVANSLLPILDHRGATTVKNTRIESNGGIIFGITLNHGVEYTGIGGMLDKAVKSRIFGQAEIKPLPEPIEIEVLKRNYPDVDDKQIKVIVHTMNLLRDAIVRQRNDGNIMYADVSTRTSKMIAWWVNKGLDIHTALEYALYNFLNNDEKLVFTDILKI